MLTETNPLCVSTKVVQAAPSMCVGDHHSPGAVMTALTSTADHTASPTVYRFLADVARSRSVRYLATEGLVATSLAVGVLMLATAWWPLAAAAASVAAYAGWGLLAHGGAVGALASRWAGRMAHGAQRLLVVLGTVSVLAALGGTAVSLFWGNAPGPYGTCYRPDGRAFPCDAEGRLRPVTRSHR
jgi:hypothetical protein